MPAELPAYQVCRPAIRAGSIIFFVQHEGASLSIDNKAVEEDSALQQCAVQSPVTVP
jgi:hypothetical protein